MLVMARPSICHFNPRPPRGGRPVNADAVQDHVKISIHAPREGGDDASDVTAIIFDISIHAPREGGDLLKVKTSKEVAQ